MRVLILGGTGEARRLAAALADRADLDVVSSLAGRVDRPALPVGQVRVGGFGGAAGLRDYLLAERVDAVIDATHPFASTMTAHAVSAGFETGVPVLILLRPPWTAGEADRWHRVPSLTAAADLVAGLGPRIFLTTGGRSVAEFAPLIDQWFLIRSVDAPHGPLPPRHEILLDRGPFTVGGELALLLDRRISAIVTKDSGGAMTAAKLAAARELGLPVVVVDRPPLPAGAHRIADTVDDAVRWLAEQAHVG